MKSVIDAVVGTLMFLGVGTGPSELYKAVKVETLLRVQKGQAPLEPFTRRLTATRP